MVDHRLEIGIDSSGRRFRVLYNNDYSGIIFLIRGESNDIRNPLGEDHYYTVNLKLQEELKKPQDHIRRFFYTLLDITQSLKDKRLKEEAIKSLTNITKKYYIQIKYTLPKHLVHLRGLDEYKLLLKEIDTKGLKYNPKTRMLSSSASDEIGINKQYIKNSFNLETKISKDNNIYGIGSCFAQNMVIAVKLRNTQSNANAYSLSDHVNTPAANMQMLRYCFEEELRENILKNSACGLEIKNEIDIEKLNNDMLQMKKFIEQADTVLYTCGSCLDIRIGAEEETESNIFPRFLTGYGLQMPNQSSLAKAGLSLTIDTHARVVKDMSNVFSYLEKKTKKDAKIIVTVSPVPVVNSVGLKTTKCTSINEVDAICKAKLRSAINVSLSELSSNNIHYFPSLEIVRFLGLYHGSKVFGAHDLHSDHLDPKIIRTISQCLIA